MKARSTQAIVAAALAIGTCCWTNTTVAAVATEQPRIRLAFVTCCVNQKFFDPLKRGMRDAAQMLDVDCDFLGTEEVDIPAQVKLFRQALAAGYDGIAVNLIDPQAFDEVVAAAVARGVPVVGFNVDDNATPNARLASVNQQLYEAGRSLARHALPDIPQGAHILLTKHDDGVSALEDRQRGIRDELEQKRVTYTMVVTGNDAARGADVVAAALQADPDIQIVLCSGQSDTEAAGRAIEKHFAGQGRWAAGFDLSPKTLQLVRDGHIRFTIDQQPYVQGFYPVVALTLKLRYGIAPSNIDAGAAIVDRANVEQIQELTGKGFR
ncbi:MAG: substrate-binding domain-containing protein [Pirellulales bacterium]